jgi:alpha/beta superfamily hydrolase
MIGANQAEQGAGPEGPALIAGPAGNLQVNVDRPLTVATPPRVVVVCHPHPQFGGTMDNKVVTTLARAATDVGWHAVRFNFRGVGSSAGTYDEGRGETEDARAVLDWAADRWSAGAPGLAGFSFGAWVAARLALEMPISRLLTVAPPVGRFADFPDRAPNCPWWVIQGLDDEVVDASQVIAWAEQLVPPPRLITLPGVSHFFHGQLAVLRDLARGFYQGKEGKI